MQVLGAGRDAFLRIRNRVLDIGCGTGYLTRLLRGCVVVLDQSSGMLELARARVPGAEFVQADVPALPFSDRAFDLGRIL